MSKWREYVRAELPSLDIPPEREIEIVDELALQLEAAYESAIAHGASDADADAAARAEVTDWAVLAATLVRIERSRTRSTPVPTPSSGGLISGVVQDFRYGARALFRTPAFTALTIVTLCAGLGLGGAAVALLDGILWRQLPYPEPDRLVLAHATVPPENRDTLELTYLDAQDLVAAGVFSSGAIAFRSPARRRCSTRRCASRASSSPRGSSQRLAYGPPLGGSSATSTPRRTKRRWRCSAIVFGSASARRRTSLAARSWSTKCRAR
jgi:hypothetical protein